MIANVSTFSLPLAHAESFYFPLKNKLTFLKFQAESSESWTFTEVDIPQNV